MKRVSQSNPSTVARRLGRRIQALRKARGFTQQQLARRLSVSTGYLGAVERGAKGLSLPTLVHLAGLLRVPIHEFFRGVDLAAGDASDGARREESANRLLALMASLPVDRLDALADIAARLWGPRTGPVRGETARPK